MESWSQAEEKLIEKLREMLDKRIIAGESVSRQFSLPSRDDSDDQINISLSVSVISTVPRMTEEEFRFQRRKLRGLLPD